MENDPYRRPTQPVERMRRHRQRQRNGLRCLVIELRETEIDTLIRKGLLNLTIGMRLLKRFMRCLITL